MDDAAEVAAHLSHAAVLLRGGLRGGQFSTGADADDGGADEWVREMASYALGAVLHV